MRESWGSRFGFIMATAGFSIGLGNIWRFPYLTGMNGGGAWVLVYLLCAFLVGIPLFAAEISLGRKAQLMPIAGMRKLTGRPTNPWNLIGWVGIAAATLIMAYYLMLIGWVLAYVVMTASGKFVGASPEAISAALPAFTGDSRTVMIYTVVVALFSGAVVSVGLQKGVERVSKIMMPMLFVILLLLLVRSITLPGAMEGVTWYLKPDFSKLTGASVLAALGQSFFSIGIGTAGAFGFGSYLHQKESDVLGNAAIVVTFDTTVAFLAGLVLFPALFAAGLEPNAGPGLLFVTLPNLFNRMPAGSLFGGAFFILVLLAGITSAIALMEVLSATLTDAFKWSRKAAVWVLTGALLLLQIPVILSQGPWADIKVQGRNFFDLFDFVSGSILLPVGGLLIVVYAGWVWGFDRFREETNVGAGRVRIPAVWLPIIKFVIPAAVLWILLSGLGIL